MTHVAHVLPKLDLRDRIHAVVSRTNPDSCDQALMAPCSARTGQEHS
jgi:hypothetical protein